MTELTPISNDEIIVNRDDYNAMELQIKQLEEALDIIRSSDLSDSYELVYNALVATGYYVNEVEVI